VIGLEGAARHTALIAKMQHISTYLLLAEQIGLALIMRVEPAYRLKVNFLGPGRQPGQCHVFDHP